MWRRKYNGYNEDDLLMEKRNVAFITDFIKFGAVNAAPLEGQDAFNYLDFSLKSQEKDGLYQDTYDFWFQIAPRLNANPLSLEERQAIMGPWQKFSDQILANRETSKFPELMNLFYIVNAIPRFDEDSTSGVAIFLVLGVAVVLVAIQGAFIVKFARKRKRRSNYELIPNDL